MKTNIAIVVAEYNSEVTFKMRDIAKAHAESLGAIIKKIIIVPGVFEIPLAVSKLIKEKDIDAVVTLGAVIKGDTNHDEVIAHSAARKILDISVESGKPVSFGVSGPGVTRENAVKRIESYARHAVEAVVRMVKI